MKVSIETDEALLETEVLIRCAEIDEYIKSLAKNLQRYDRHIVAVESNQKFIVPIREILYIESIDSKTFLYTQQKVLEADYRLYELEEKFSNSGFSRVAKNCLVNLYHIISFHPYVGGRLLAKLDNNEELVISRKYAKAIKEKLYE